MDKFNFLLDKLINGSEDEAVNAAHAIGDNGYIEGIQVLIKTLETTESNSIRNAAAIGLRELGSDEAIQPLLRQIRKYIKTNNCGTLVYALQTLDCSKNIEDLINIICDGGWESREMALEAMVKINKKIPHIDIVNSFEKLNKSMTENSIDLEHKEHIKGALSLLEELKQDI